jgi:hypothetical protein
MRNFSTAKRKPKPEQVESLIRRLDQLLCERDAQNARLTELYRGSANDKDLKLFARAERLRLKWAKRVYKSQRSLAGRLEKLHAPLDIKERVWELMNKKTVGYSDLEYTRYLLRHKRYRKGARRELRERLASARRTMRYVKSDIRRFMKKAERHDDNHKSDRAWVIKMLVALICAVVIGISIFANYDWLSATFVSIRDWIAQRL